VTQSQSFSGTPPKYLPTLRQFPFYPSENTGEFRSRGNMSPEAKGETISPPDRYSSGKYIKPHHIPLPKSWFVV